MASIIVDLSDDIKKLQSLKTEIQEVKKELGSINVNVHIDIKRDMEAKLKSLTGQYDALVQKVSQAEGKVIASTQRINQAAEKIIKAQEQLAKATGTQPQAGNVAGASTAANQAQTAGVQAQAKAYDELKDAIEDYLGTMEGNARYIAETELAIKRARENISLLHKDISSKGGIASEAQIKNLTHYTEELSRLKLQLQEAKRDFNTDLRINIAGEGSLKQLQNQLLQLQRVWDNMAESVRNSPTGQQFASSIKALNQQVSELEQTMGRYQRNVGNYASGWNGLSMSIQQIGRELPSLAMGVNTFFLAISNNLPILTDEIARARKEYNALKAAGQAATPVWRQVVSSLLSWQTALTVSITLLTVYGKDIAEWVGNLFKAKDGTAELEAATKRMNTAVSEVYGNISEEMRNLRSLNDALQDAKRGTEEWESIRQKIVTGYSKYLPSIDSEIEKTGTLAGSYDRLAESIQRAAAARGFEKYSAEEDEKYFEERNKQLQRVYDAFIDQLGDDEGLKQYQKWLRLLDSGEGLSRTQQGEFGRISVGWGLGNANSVLFELRKAQEAHDKALERYREIFNMSEGAEAALPPDSIKAMRESIAARREALEQMSVGSKEYNKLKAQIEADEKELERITQKQEKTDKETDKRKQSQQKLSDELLSLQEKNQQDEIALMKEGTEKQLAEIELRYKREKEAIINQQRELAEANKEAGITSTNANGLTTGQQAEIDRANKLATESRKKQIEDVYRAETDAMLAYISEYGTFQQKKLAIAQEYARKIADAQTEGDRLSLEKERDQKLSGMEAEALKMSIDWPAVFGEFGGMFDDIMKPTLEKVKQYMQTDDFRNLQPTDQSEIVEAVNRMEQSLGGAGKVSFKQLGKEVQTLQQSMRELNNAKQEEAEALQRLAEAQEAYENALANGTDREKAAAELKLNAAKEEADNASENTRKAEENAQQNQKTTTETATTLKANMENVTQGLQQLASGGIQAAYEGLLKLAKGSGNDKMGEISDKLGDVFIIGWILSILDILKDGLSTVVEGLLDGIFSAVSGILSDVLSGDLFVTLFDSIKSGVGSILDAITFGGFSSWTSSSNAKEVQATIDRLTDRNEALQSSIDALNDTMKEARGTETVQAAKQAEEYQKEVNRNYLEMAMAQAGYHGSHHSWNYYWGGFSQEQIDKLSEQIGREWSGSLWDLSPEEMKMLKGNVDMWTQIQNTGEGGYGGRLTEKLDDYIDQAGKLEEITDTLYESLTQISFDSMYDSFIDSLMDMEYSAEDAANNISEYFMRAMLSNKIGSMYADKLEEWYKKFAESMEDDGTLDSNEIAALRDEYLGYVEEALKLRDDLAAATGYEGTSAQEQQSATSRGFETMTQDQASELNGRFTALYESSLRQESIQQGIGNIAEDARNIIAQSYLELQQINENTGNSAKYLKDIKADIAVVKQNTSRL